MTDQERLRCQKCSEMGELRKEDGKWIVSSNGSPDKKSKSFSVVCCQTYRSSSIEEAVGFWDRMHDEENGYD